MTDEADEDYVYTVAVCPVNPELAGQVVALAEVIADSRDWIRDVHAAAEDAGWSEDDLVSDVDAAYRTAPGHMVYIEDRVAIPFMYEYWLGTELTPEDFWGEVPGWTSHSDPGPAFFDAQIEAAVQAFAAVLAVGHSTDGFSYHQNDLGALCVFPRPPREPLPTAQRLVELIAW